MEREGDVRRERKRRKEWKRERWRGNGKGSQRVGEVEGYSMKEI